MIRRPPRSTLFPYTRSSDLPIPNIFRSKCNLPPLVVTTRRQKPRDRKSTRLNSSHQIISYAVFCLKKKNGIMRFCSADQASCCTGHDLATHSSLVAVCLVDY